MHYVVRSERRQKETTYFLILIILTTDSVFRFYAEDYYNALCIGLGFSRYSVGEGGYLDHLTNCCYLKKKVTDINVTDPLVAWLTFN